MAKLSQRKRLIEVTLAAPADQAWQALRDPAQIREWFGYYGADYASWGMDHLKTLDDEIKAIFVDKANVDEELRRITWEGGDEFLLTPRGEESVLEVFMVRPAPSHELDWRRVYDPICEGWITFVEQLRFYLDGHRHEERSTIFMAGLPAPRAFEMLNLEELASVEPGEGYELTTAMGEQLSGEVWFKSHYQVGLTVDKFGDGLLIVRATPSNEELPDGGAEILITTFLDDETFEELQRRWGLAFSSGETPQSSSAAP